MTSTRKVYSDNAILAKWRETMSEPWSDTMEAWFAVAEYMYREGESIPSEWDFHPGLDVRYAHRVEWAEGYMVGESVMSATEDERLFAGRVLTKYAAVLKIDGQDY